MTLNYIFCVHHTGYSLKEYPMLNRYLSTNVKYEVSDKRNNHVEESLRITNSLWDL